MNIFIDDDSCKSNIHCVTCRDKEGGRAFRESLGRMFILPVDAPDFVCPYGKDWGFQQPSKGFGDTFNKWMKLLGIKKEKCGGCSKRQNKWNKWFPYKK